MKRRTKLIVAGVGLSVALGASGVVWLARPSAASQLSLGQVTTGELTQTLSGTGAVASTGSVDVSFPASATVTSVKATVGDTVTAGQVLATIDTTDLAYALAEAKLKVSEAQEALAEAKDAADDSTSSASASASSTAGNDSNSSTASGGSAPAGGESTVSGGASSATPSATSGSTSSTPSGSSGATQGNQTQGSGTDSVAKVTAQLKSSRAAFDKAWSAFSDDLASTTQTCIAAAALEPSASPEPSASAEPSATAEPTSEPTAEPTAEPSPTSEPSVEPSASASPTATATDASAQSSAQIVPAKYPAKENTPSAEDCITALEALEKVEKQASDARSAYDSVVDELVKIAGSSSGSTSGESAAPSGSAGEQSSTGQSSSTQSSTGSQSAAGASSGSSDQASTTTPSLGSSASTSGAQAGGAGGQATSTTVGQAQASLDEAELAYANAEVALKGATLTAPASGTLTALPFVEGQTANTSDVATVDATGGVKVTIDVPVDDIGKVAVGQDVSLTSATGVQSKATVSSIALLPTTSDSSATYPVTIAVTDPDAGLAVGTNADAVVTVASSQSSVLVPISAITLTGNNAGTVQVLDNGTVTPKEVTIGIRGTTHVEVTDGLSAGDQVVLADASVAIPTGESSGQSDGSIVISGGTGMSGGGPGMPPGR